MRGFKQPLNITKYRLQCPNEAMISKELFLKVNNIVTEKRSYPSVHKEIDQALPLKKFMRCEACDTPMTGYLVKAKALYYYKCRVTGCKQNVSAKKVHEVFAKLISIFQIDKVDKPLIEETVTTYYDSFFEEQNK